MARRQSVSKLSGDELKARTDLSAKLKSLPPEQLVRYFKTHSDEVQRAFKSWDPLGDDFPSDRFSAFCRPRAQVSKVVDELQPIPGWGEQDEWGNDLAKLRYNLTLTDDQKLEQHQRAARFVLECILAADRAGVRRPSESAE
ncbi:MAG TPA: hypothetical protein VG944_22970 [Fimbriimonas sp.]|nr:hypothetical protein [Fimbriimonas sp.]